MVLQSAASLLYMRLNLTHCTLFDLISHLGFHCITASISCRHLLILPILDCRDAVDDFML